MIDRRLLENIDWFLVGLLLLNSLFGALIIYSSSHYLPGNYALRQLIWIAASLIALFLFLVVDYKVLLTYSTYFYGALMLVLVLMLFTGTSIAGAKSWIRISSFQVQPSELAKIALILVLAHFFSERKTSYISSGTAVLGFGLTAVPFILVACQPDLGTAMCFLPLLLGALIMAGLRRKAVVVMAIVCLLAGIAGWNLALKDYQKKRLTTVVFPGKDPQGAGYHILQSKIAIGSGGLFGKGFKKGTQSQLRFLPARHTDFVFSVVGEELGFIGVVAALLLCYLFVSRIFRSAGKSRDRAGVYLVYLVGTIVTFQILVNVSMVIGLFPIVGIPLPLFSYGGSSLLANYLGVSLVLNVKMRRFVNI
ncbi:MAG: rod shape-determining protein RodA [Clostridiales bacterium]|nr:rod shape-determining protein RodA [Clostridiales bacterium]